jgi:hypothetical protein
MNDRWIGRAIALTLVGAAAGALAWGLRRHSAGRLPEGVEEWHCDCGQAFRVVGTGRHRVYWPDGAERGEPVLSGACPACERPLPV